MEKKTYQTSGRQRLGKFFADHPDVQFSAEELCEAINGNCESGKSTVYRHLTELCRAEVVQRVHSAKRGCYVYQYVGSGCDCRSHFHGKCVQCGTAVRIFLGGIRSVCGKNYYNGYPDRSVSLHLG